MNRITSKILVSTVAFALAAPVFANEAAPELQPKPVEFGWFKRPADATTYIQERSGSSENQYRFLTDTSPL